MTEICEKELPLIEPNKELRETLFFENGIERKSVALSKQATYADAVPEQKKKLLEMIHGLVQNENEQSEHRKIQAMLTGTPYARSPLCDMPGEGLERVAEQCIEQAGVYPERILSLNFNYTPTFEKLYAPGVAILEIVNIHGELNNPANPIIFGYGDELDDDYKEIEKTHDNDFMDNMKHIQYNNTSNYRNLLGFLQMGSYQVFIMGHSCGNSDRTLLNTIFEHENCISVKPFYHQWRNEETGAIEDNYKDIVKNISRNFNDKQAMRDVVVNKEFCEPLVPVHSTIIPSSAGEVHTR